MLVATERMASCLVFKNLRVVFLTLVMNTVLESCSFRSLTVGYSNESRDRTVSHSLFWALGIWHETNTPKVGEDRQE